ncbi:MAG TPA: nucleoside 2-deoxyribosyltransferase [Sedimentisphaerales bacterium]|nr:nucleoside 2-deoxyribosyltransferase [Sedimentisphaerales bacterium]
MGDKPYKIYCAGPLFNPKEREEMQEIASVLEAAGYSVFLPHRDGLEFALLFPMLLQRSVTPQQARDILNQAIFSLDVFQIADCDGLVLNMNGRVPDEGAMVEAGIAWACNKVLVIFRTDSRSLIEGNCNPMVLGLSDFSFVTTHEGILRALDDKFSKATEDVLLSREPHFDRTAKNGRQISEFLAGRRPVSDITDLVIGLFGERTCQITEGARGNCSQMSSPQ